ncbi:MAG TPA: NAD-dependent epimerase/dehydratase family protein [Chitinophagaceae bacterium]|jgi:UDP-glucose 4-epimerase|nr:NAD-dependent epimerase/dehydratase family protein [Chitinophagaceae bacterium]
MINLSGKKILVTGGAGFIGSNLVKKLVQEYHAIVTVLDDLFTGDRKHLEGVKCHFVKGSVEDVALVNELVSSNQIVFHLAARNIIISNKNPREDLEVNVVGSFNIFEACLKYKIERVVYASTASVYGNPIKLPIQEEDNKRFLSFYSASKYNAEVYAKAFYEVNDLPVSVVRYSNVYGSNQSHVNPYCGVIGKFIKAALIDEPIQIHGDGEQTRDFTFIEDAVSATIAAAVSPKAIGEVYNVATGIETSVNHLVEIILEYTSSKSPVVYIDNRDIDNIRRRVMDIEKTRHDLKYQPLYSMKKGLSQTINWYREFFKYSFHLLSVSEVTGQILNAGI